MTEKFGKDTPAGKRYLAKQPAGEVQSGQRTRKQHLDWIKYLKRSEGYAAALVYWTANCRWISRATFESA